MPAALPIHPRVVPRPAQVTHRLLRWRGRAHLRQQPSPVQLGQFAGVAPVGFDPLARLPGHQRGRDDLTAQPGPLQPSLQRIATRPGLIAALDLPGRGRFQLPSQPIDRARLVPRCPRHRRRGRTDQHRHVQFPFVRVDPNVSDRLVHDRLLSSAALTP